MKLSERSEFASFPILRLAQLGITLRRLLLLTLLGEARKVSSRRSTTGQQSHNNDGRTSSTEQPQTKTPASPARISHAARRPACLEKRMEYARWQRSLFKAATAQRHACDYLAPIELAYFYKIYPIDTPTYH
ncbi:hypothetical protein [Undibacterium sp.]|uniref:hypothetical protein n=1 Tax=Undibacterium sp. TaxID=1914977 RepID=UPI0025F23F28|nr:hypothetical protein [Undibacterium sp.]